MAKTTILAAKEVGKMITGFARSMKHVTSAAHTIAVQCLLHAERHGDIRLLDRFFNAMLAGGEAGKTLARTVAFKKWVRDHAPIAWEKGEKIVLIPEGEQGYIPFNIDAAEAKPFYEYTEEKVPEVSVEGFMKVIHGMRRKVESLKKGETKYTLAEGETLDHVERFLKRLPKEANENNSAPITDESQLVSAKTVEGKKESKARRERKLQELAQASDPVVEENAQAQQEVA